ncbi:MAG: hypothetical protein AAGM38_18755 [Pseudomonadota bacterium]
MARSHIAPRLRSALIGAAALVASAGAAGAQDVVDKRAALDERATLDERAAFYGSWGTPAQCAGAPIKPGGAVRAAPFEIGAEWLQHGPLWCRLTWFPIERRENGFFSGAHAQCGEDAVRSYFLGMVLADDELTLRWSFGFSNGPLKRCSNS